MPENVNPALSNGWERLSDASGRMFYANHFTKQVCYAHCMHI